MSRTLASLSVVASLLASTAVAEVPRVAVDIAPVHSLVARVMHGVGTPDLILPPGASPHEHNLRPSEASAMQDADLVVWVGPDLTPWMTGAIGTLADDAAVLELFDVDGITRLSFRDGALFEAHSHDDHAQDDHDHDAHDHGDDEHAGHAHGDDDHGHDHGDFDAHAWLSPDNASIWLNAIANALSSADPDNATAYFGNAAAAQEELVALTNEIDSILAPVRGMNYVVFHDAYQYFETAFDIPASGAISLSDATDPSPARIAEIQTRVADEGIGCVLSEPQFNPGLVATVMDGTTANTAVVDPIGSDLEPGAALYPQMMRNLARALAGCF